MSDANNQSDVIVGVLIAGGGSRRMGTEKAMIGIGGKPMFRHPADALAAVSDTAVQVGGEPLPGLGWQVLRDSREDAGPAAGLEAALSTFPGAVILVCPVDTPLVRPHLLRALLDLIDHRVEAAAPRWRGRWHPLLAAYNQEFLEPLGDWLDGGRRDLQGLLDARPVAELSGRALSRLGPPDLVLANVNEPDDLERVREAVDEVDRLAGG